MKKNLHLLFAMLFSICAMSLSAETTTVEVEWNSNSGINNANYTAMLTDGTILGFNRSGSYTYFCGAITTATSVVVPDRISYNGTEYDVQYFSYSSSANIDFDEAPNVISLTLPSVLTYIYNSVPSSISELHLQGTNPPYLYSSNYISSSTTVYVPQSALSTYQNYCNNGNSGWNTNIDVRSEGWTMQSFTLTVNTPGTLGNVLLSTVEQWTDVDELVIIGHLNEDDLKLLTRLKQMRKLDLSQTDITVMTGCSGLTLLKEVLLPSTVVEVAENAFEGCNRLNKINLPNAIIIGSSAFQSCSSLSSVSLPAATEIGSYAFQYCSSLSSVSLPAATEIGSYAFESCSSLSSVSIPAATEIGSSAFEYCSSLSSVSLPSCLQSLGGSAFSGCSKLEDVYCHVIAPLTTTAFSNNAGSSATLHVPGFSLASYMLSDSWYTFYRIVALDGILDELAIGSDFTITDYAGLADKVNLTIKSNATGDCGHLTVSANTPWKLGKFNFENYMWVNGYRNNWRYPYCNSLISSNEITADEVEMDFCVQTGEWNFISFPFDVNVSDIEVPEGTLWVIRKYSGADRAALTGNTWQNMTNGMTLKAGEGYILHCANDILNTTGLQIKVKAINNTNKNRIFAYNDVVQPLSTFASEYAHNRSWNLVGNPYPSYYKTTAIEHNGVITVWNGSGYSAFSLLDDNYVLRPNEAFFVQCPSDATSMTFKAEGRTHVYSANYEDEYYYDSKPRQSRTMDNRQRKVYNLTMGNADYTDRTRLVINPQAKMDYEISCDACKFMSSNTSVPQIYIIENGQKMAIDERPLYDGTIALGMYFGETGDYTIGMSSASADAILLTDNATGKTVNLSSETYSFSASKGTNDNRFTIQIDGVTGIENISAGETKKSEIYNISGQKLSAPQKGINIINGNKILTK